MSNYKAKQKFKKPTGAVTPVKKVPPVFSYPCDCHGVPANKPPCAIDKASEFKDRNKLEHSLGTWNCSITRKACKVSRTKYKEESNDVQRSEDNRPETSTEAQVSA